MTSARMLAGMRRDQDVTLANVGALIGSDVSHA
jgi:hypothetical protein